jgi:hypothetical protein
MHPTPSLIHAQIKGHEMPNQTTKVEYQLRTRSGAIASSFDSQELVEPYIEARIKKWGKAAPALILFRVTTIVEQI